MAINLTSKLNYKIEDQEERIKLVNDILKEYESEINNYYDNYFNVHPNAGEHGDNLSSEDKMCKQLETISNYILFCPGAERINKKTEYNFYTEKQFEEKEKNKPNVDVIVDKINKNRNSYESTINPKTNNEVVDYLIRKGNNYKKEIKQEIDVKKDLNDPELVVVKEYQDYINSLKGILDNLRLTKKNKKMQYKLVKHMNFCKTDQIYCKDKIKGTIYFKDVLPDSTDIDYDQFDFFDKEHVLCLLKFEPRKLTTDLGILIYDLSQLLKHIKLSKQDKKILNMWRDDTLTQESMAKLLEVSPSYISSTLNRIADKVTKVFEAVYEDYYYLNLVKGKYKKCSKCGKIKLANERYFRKRNDNKGDGFYNYCRLCEKINKSDE